MHILLCTPRCAGHTVAPPAAVKSCLTTPACLPLSYNPFAWLDPANIERLVAAMVMVYENVERPYIDANDDGTPDEQQDPEVLREQLRAEVCVCGGGGARLG
jgi:hypothetical protein